MSTATLTNAWRAAFDTLDETRDLPAELREIRARGFRRFEQLGFPTLRHEDWRFTDVSPIANAPFVPAGQPPRALETSFASAHLTALERPHLTFLNGRLIPPDASLSPLPQSVTVCTLKDALRTHGNIVRSHLDRLAGEEDEAFTALNAAFLDTGAFVHIGPGVNLDQPVLTRHILVSGAAPLMIHPRTLVVVEAGARATIVEDHVTLGDGPTFANPVTEFYVREGANAHHYHLGRGSEQAWRISSLYIEQDANTDFASHSVLLGGALVRNNVLPRLAGENAESVLNGLYLPRGVQHHDSRMRVRHAEPNCRSRQYYRGILDDRAKAMFTGRIIVDPGAQKTDAVQSNKNLLLSDDAMVETKPQLEIYADDVKCTHGATIGQIDEESIFYCKARGIPEGQARRLLVLAFANEILERMEWDALRDELRATVFDRLLEQEGVAR